MDHALKHGPVGAARLSRAKAREYQVMFWASLPAFIAVAGAKRLMPRNEAYHGTLDTSRRGIVADAVNMAHTIIPFAFMR